MPKHTRKHCRCMFATGKQSLAFRYHIQLRTNFQNCDNNTCTFLVYLNMLQVFSRQTNVIILIKAIKRLTNVNLKHQSPRIEMFHALMFRVGTYNIFLPK